MFVYLVYPVIALKIPTNGCINIAPVLSRAGIGPGPLNVTSDLSGVANVSSMGRCLAKIPF